VELWISWILVFGFEAFSCVTFSRFPVWNEWKTLIRNDSSNKFN